MERKIFWIVVVVLGSLAVLLLPLWWAVLAAVPIVLIAWWIGYQSPWMRRFTAINKRPHNSNRDDTPGKHAA